MAFLLRLVVRLLPHAILDELQDTGLKELDRRGLIIWCDEIPEEFLDHSKQE
ncbi:hypothetical protein H6H01_10645 [Nostoc calcicola FACHB-3891]|nr:hypothetical protein [Nostoc calcicola FACHB-3891]